MLSNLYTTCNINPSIIWTTGCEPLVTACVWMCVSPPSSFSTSFTTTNDDEWIDDHTFHGSHVHRNCKWFKWWTDSDAYDSTAVSSQEGESRNLARNLDQLPPDECDFMYVLLRAESTISTWLNRLIWVAPVNHVENWFSCWLCCETLSLSPSSPTPTLFRFVLSN